MSGPWREGPAPIGVAVKSYEPLIYIHINVNDCGITSDMSKFPDDTKIEKLISSDNDAEVLLEEVNGLCERAGRQMTNAVHHRQM